jgi:hypothetical protein
MIRLSKQRIFGCLFLLAGAPASGALRIEVLRGEGANNNGATNAAISPVVRVFNANEPVAGALVVFTVEDTGPRVEFSGSGEVGEAVTDESGFAASPRVQPAGGNGPVSIAVVASKDGEFAQAVIHQMNLGIGEKGARDAELDVVAIPPGSWPAPAHGLNYRVRVDDGKGETVPGAAIDCTLRKTDKAGEGIAVWHSDLIADQHGEAECTARKLPGGVSFVLAVRAESQGRRATRYFPVR